MGSTSALLWRASQKDAAENQKGMQGRVEKILSVASLELRGNIASAGGQFEPAHDMLQEAARKEKDIGYSEPPLYSRPAQESLGFACIRAGRWDDARAAFQQVLEERSKSGFGLYGIALAWDRQGNREKASAAYEAFLAAWKNADKDLPQVEAARAYLNHVAARVALSK